MKGTFFDEELIKANQTISCPTCKTKHTISLNDSEISCEVCGECVELETKTETDDFVWHPSLLF